MKLSESWKAEKAKLANDELVTGLVSGGLGFLAGLFTPHH